VISFAQKALKDGQVMSKLHVIELGSVPGAWRSAVQSFDSVQSSTVQWGAAMQHAAAGHSCM
jgi:hypothetical protein